MKLNNLRVGQKLALAFAMTVLLQISIAVVSYLSISQLRVDMELTDKDRYPKTVLVHSIKDALNQSARSMRNLLLVSDPSALSNEYAAIENSAEIVTISINKLEKTITSVKGQALLKELQGVREKFVDSRAKFLQLTKEAHKDEALHLLSNETVNIQLSYFKVLDDLIAYQNDLMEASARSSEANADTDIKLIIAISLFAIASSIVLAMTISRSITRPLHRAVQVARRVSEGDLTTDIVVDSNDETGQLLTAFKDMNENLLKIVSQVRSGTETIATASTEIAAGNMDLSSRTEEQASSLEETAASMEEITSTVKQNADNARQANQLARSASEVATRGGEVVNRVVNTMGSIDESAKKIVDIISVIEGIAFQTNILALNAAVEAARAGEQGRGFAVVASEVRTLAQRSASAAKEIKHLINDSVAKVAEGSKLVGEAGSTMGEIVVSVKRVSDVISDISAASHEQNSGIEQINVAIIQMDNVTQQNASLVEEAAAAAESMQEQARLLSEVVSVFKLKMHAETEQKKTTVVQRVNRAANSISKRAVSQLNAARTTMPRATVATKRLEASTGTIDLDWEEF